MRTARSSGRPGGLRQAPPSGPGIPPHDQAPLRARHPPGAGTPQGPGTHPPVNRITDTCKNITFPQLRLRMVKKLHKTPLINVNPRARPASLYC